MLRKTRHRRTKAKAQAESGRSGKRESTRSSMKLLPLMEKEMLAEAAEVSIAQSALSIEAVHRVPEFCCRSTSDVKFWGRRNLKSRFLAAGKRLVMCGPTKSPNICGWWEIRCGFLVEGSSFEARDLPNLNVQTSSQPSRQKHLTARILPRRLLIVQ